MYTRFADFTRLVLSLKSKRLVNLFSISFECKQLQTRNAKFELIFRMRQTMRSEKRHFHGIWSNSSRFSFSRSFLPFVFRNDSRSERAIRLRVVFIIEWYVHLFVLLTYPSTDRSITTCAKSTCASKRERKITNKIRIANNNNHRCIGTTMKDIK